MMDLALSATGDIMFMKKPYMTNRLKVSFVATKAKAMKVSFAVIDTMPEQRSANGIKISFDVVRLQNDKEAILLYDENAKAQGIKIRLLTALGEINGKPNTGSKLELVKHKQLFDPKTKADIISIVKNALSDIMPNIDVRVAPVVDRSNGYDQKMVVYIYEDGLLAFKYEVNE
jgi:phage baseplate assembly protein W